ncbi:protein JINGUBANG-like [Typha latifolia]|uniref:protein JINGUBANG-like n=1 Tax=Typha latifolia TaxID=4733 RepID=UPI003C2AEB64
MRAKLFNLLRSDPTIKSHSEEEDSIHNDPISPMASPGYASDLNPTSTATSPYYLSPWNPAAASPFAKSPWTHLPALSDVDPKTGLIYSLVREEGHVYSLAASGDLLYTGSDSKNIRVWKNRREFAGFKSSSGLVKAIVISGDKIFTGHQDGKIRIWKVSPKDPSVYRRVGSLPRLKDFLKSSINPSNYVEVRRHKNTVWIRHFDAVSCLSLDEGAGLLYSGSWDKTVKVWRVSDSKCLESIPAHDDAVNSVAAFDGMVFTGSADGTVKVWRREVGNGGAVRHVAVRTLLKGESAVTALAVAREAGVVYSGSSDGAVHHWDLRRRMEYGGVLRGHTMAVLCLAAAGSLVISGSADKTLCVWRRGKEEGHVRVTVLAGHAGPIKCVAAEVEAEEREVARGPRWVVYSGSLDRSVKVWLVSENGGQVIERTPPHVWGSVAGRHEWPRRSPMHLRGRQEGPRKA